MRTAIRHLALATGLVTLVAFVPTAAGAATSHRAPTTSGVVVAHDTARGTLTLAGARHQLVTLRTRDHVALGALVAARTTRLADGTYRVASLHVVGRRTSTVVSGTFVARQGNRATLAGGGSVIAVTLPAIRAASTPLTPGQDVTTTVDLAGGGLDATSVSTTATPSSPVPVELAGVVTAVSATAITLRTEDGSSIIVAVPAGFTLPSGLVVGSHAELVTSLSTSGTSTLISAATDGAATLDSAGLSTSPGGEVTAEGLVVGVGANSVTIQPGDGASPVSFTTSSTGTTSSLSVGQSVTATGNLANGELDLASVSDQASSSETQSVEAAGVVLSVSASSLTIQPGDGGAALTFAVPSTVDVSAVAVGSRVHVNGAVDSTGTLTLSDLRPAGDGSTSGTGSTDGSGSGGSGSAGSGTTGEGESSDFVGLLSAVSASQLTLQPTDGSPAITIAVPSTVDVSTFTVGQLVVVHTQLVASTLTLVSIKAGEQPEPLETQGVITAIGTGTISVALAVAPPIPTPPPTGTTTPPAPAPLTLTLNVPASIDLSAFSVGENVKITYQPATAATTTAILVSISSAQ